ncbi:MAG TPA: tRNA (guanine(46)-N(7))-methyltransferase TrmB [Ilumatobacteraceae bacterium]|jgi:tRNA (guanine-N7-)-methyltransferase|nr:tRNA (guanine(46)-N(7))-methyltransferase TrmB [Ilumatobacteraceae bacterium]
MSIPAAVTHPPQRSFKPRRRGLSASRIDAYRRSMERWGIAIEGPTLSFDTLFGTADGEPVDVVLDIGFGGGEALVEVAEVRPDENVIGVDVHTPGVAAVLEAVEVRGLRNVRVVEGDVIDFIGRIPVRSLAAARMFFPDPWPKQRQRSRRLVRHDFLDRLVPVLRIGGTIHIATDSADYASHVRAVCDARPDLIGGVIERPSWRPTTRFERRGVDEGRLAVDLLYSTSLSSPSDSSSALR